MLFRYDPKLSFNGDITLIRAKASQIIENTIGKDYGLTDVTTVVYQLITWYSLNEFYHFRYQMGT